MEVVNPYKAGAGHSPPYLAGREEEVSRFGDILEEHHVTKNVILTGLRGVGKTVLMDDKFKPLAISKHWAWVGSDFSESAFLSERSLSLRLLTDLSVYSSSLFSEELGVDLTFDVLDEIYESTPGLSTDKLKAVIERVFRAPDLNGCKGVIFAYDEAQVVTDAKSRDEYPLAMLLETFQSIQRKGVRCLLLLTGLPTLLPRLIESRTYAERMFEVFEIGRLKNPDARRAITEPLKEANWQFTEDSVTSIVATADGYPYFLQFICKQAFDFKQANPPSNKIPIDPIVQQLDGSFFAGRWENLTDRQRDLLACIAHLENADSEFTIAEIVNGPKRAASGKRFKAGDVSAILPRIMEKGLIYKNRTGKYCFAVPLLHRFICRQNDRQIGRQKRLFK